MSTASLGGVEGTWMRYWDEASTAAVLEFKVEEPVVQPVVAPVKEKKDKKKTKCSSSAIFSLILPLMSSEAVYETTAPPVDERPMEASALPVSDKPVTLSFKGGLMGKQGTTVANADSARKPAPLSLAFSLTEDALLADATAGEDENQKSTAEDPKGLSHTLRSTRMALWMWALTCSLS